MRATTPTLWMSAQRASSVSSSSWAAQAITRSTTGRSSSICSDRGRPTASGTIICGKTTVFLSGRTGSRAGTTISSIGASLRHDHAGQ